MDEVALSKRRLMQETEMSDDSAEAKTPSEDLKLQQLAGGGTSMSRSLQPNAQRFSLSLSQRVGGDSATLSMGIDEES